MHPSISICLVFLGCCSNVVFLELLVREVPSVVNTITFFQFLFIAVEGLIFTSKFGTNKPIIPIRVYATMVAFFFLGSVINNYALNFNISMPLHMIFRSGSLVANMALGILIQKRSYKLSKYLSVLMITMGIAICTIVSAKKAAVKESSSDSSSEYFWWCTGVSLLIVALLLSARTGIYQEQMYAEYGKHPREALFYAHALPLPGFLFLSSDILRHIFLLNSSDPFVLSGVNLIVPRLWLYVVANLVTQYLCIRSVYVLTSECTSLTVTLVVTLRKFVSLVISIVYFKNPFTALHWLGTALVFCGTFIFLELVDKIVNFTTTPKDGKTE